MSVSLVWGSTLEKAQAGALTQESARSSFVLPPGGLRQGYGSQYHASKRYSRGDPRDVGTCSAGA